MRRKLQDISAKSFELTVWYICAEKMPKMLCDIMKPVLKLSSISKRLNEPSLLARRMRIRISKVNEKHFLFKEAD
jgi:hypothetical protein